ncbi:hypothetical protein [Rhizobium grahamii]|uniref:Uncharacterized protein n=1 Tax=Rhizobium grahamii TaxID=1120045 RepID=A0A370KFR3_9HYPH|nr:hypothetical protein [Rhizobium grahamii]RDJ03288.1 hypothetical protein B5K06_30295 [Rhizobium grahamii]
MGLTLAICFVLGAVSALRMPILVFTLVVMVVMAAYAIFSVVAGMSSIMAFGWSMALASMLEAGYIFTHTVLYLVYVRRADETRAPRKIQSKYTAD